MTALSKAIKRKSKVGNLSPARVIDTHGNRATVKISGNGATMHNLAVIGGPVSKDDAVSVDFSLETPVVLAYSPEAVTTTQVKRSVTSSTSPGSSPGDYGTPQTITPLTENLSDASGHSHALSIYDTTTPEPITPGISGTYGDDDYASRADHIHEALCAAPSGDLGVSSTNAEGSASSLARSDHSHALDWSDNPGAASKILGTNSTGGTTIRYLILESTYVPQLKVKYDADHDFRVVSTATYQYFQSSDLMAFVSGGDLMFQPGSGDIVPSMNYAYNLGRITDKYLTLHAAELWVETLVAQETMTTIGGRLLIAPSNILENDLSSGSTTMYVKYNNFASGDIIYMEANGSVEFMLVGSAPGGSGPYSYTITRDLDGTGANNWYAGDSMVSTGSGAGQGWIDLYSIYGQTKGTVSGSGIAFWQTGFWDENDDMWGDGFWQLAGSESSATSYGPSIVGNVRNSSTYNDWSENWAVGNLKGLYGQASDIYGFAAGKYGANNPYIIIDDTNGLNIFNNGDEVITLDMSGNSYFAGIMTIGVDGEIRQGSGTWGSSWTGLRVWRDTGVGRIGGYNTSVLQWWGDTDGRFYWGGGASMLDNKGIQLDAHSSSDPDSGTGISWGNSTVPFAMSIQGLNIQYGVDYAPELWTIVDASDASWGSPGMWRVFMYDGGTADAALEVRSYELHYDIHGTELLRVDTDNLYSGAPFARYNDTTAAEVEGGIVVTITPINLTDTSSNQWQGTLSRTTGTYQFNLQAAANGSLPSDVKGVFVRIGTQQDPASSSYAGIREYGSSDIFSVGIRHLYSSSVPQWESGLVPIPAGGGDIEVVIGGGNATNCQLVLTGYIV